MRDEEGIYIGHHICPHYQGVDRFEMRECCGGRLVKVAYITCDIKETLLAEPYCSAAGCKVFQRERRTRIKNPTTG